MKNRQWVFPAFLLACLITYIPSIGSGFVFDFPGWQQRYEAGQFSDVLHAFGYPSNQQAMHLFFYSLYKLFYIQGIPWYLVFCGLHAFNVWLTYKWLSALNGRWNLRLQPSIVLLVCFIFLLHPYVIEPVVWKACIHYLLSLAAIMSILHWTTQWLSEWKRKYAVRILLVYAISLFLLELSYITPVFVLLFTIIDRAATGNKKSFDRKTWLLIGAMWALLGCAVIINKITLGSWVGHYGADVHFNLDLLNMAGTELKYLVKHVFDARFLSYPQKAKLFDVLLSDKTVIFCFIAVLLVGVVAYFSRLKKWTGRMHVFMLGLAGTLLFTLPVSNLYLYYLHVGMNDRFSYVPLLFVWIALLPLIAKLAKQIAIALLIVVLCFHLYWQQKIMGYWHTSTEVLQSLKADYRWHDRSHVFVLNSPDHYRGIVMASAIKADSGIDELIDYQTPHPNEGKMYDIYQFNMTHPMDGVKVEQTDSMTLKVTFNQWGNWWHRADGGVVPYENEYFKAEPLDYPYQVTFKQLPPNSAIIYQDSMKWKEVIINDK